MDRNDRGCRAVDLFHMGEGHEPISSCGVIALHFYPLRSRRAPVPVEARVVARGASGSNAGTGASSNGAVGGAQSGMQGITTGTAAASNSGSGLSSQGATQATPNKSINSFEPNGPATNLASQSGQSGVANGSNSRPGQSATQTSPNNTSTPAANAQNPAQTTVIAEQNNAVSGSKTAAPAADVVSAPGVGIDHAANGLPIGSPGSGLGSPEQPIRGK